ETEPETVTVTLKATDQEGGPVIGDGLIWIVRDSASGDIVYESDAPEGVLTAELEEGATNVSVVRVADEANADGKLDVGSGHDSLTLPIITTAKIEVTAP